MSYIGKSPTPVPLSTADYQDGSVTGPKLAPNAAVQNIGYTPFDAAGGTISGNVDITGTTDLTDTDIIGDLAVTGTTDLDGDVTQLSGTFTLFQDPTTNLEAATKQYVDNNFQLATGAVQPLNTDLTLTAASARVFEFTAVAQYVRVNLPDATTLSISNGKFVFRNEGGNPFGVYDNAGNLIGSVGPQSTATCYLYSIATAAGKWSLIGDDVRPFYVANSNTLTQSGVATQDTLVSTNVAVTVKLTDTSYVIIHPDNTATNQQIVAYAVDTSTRPATIGNRTVIPQLSTGTGVGNFLVAAASLQNVVWAFRVTNTTLYVANASNVNAHAVLTVTGTSISTVSTIVGAFLTVPQTSTTLTEFSQIQKVADNFYVYMNATTATTFSYQPFKIEGTTIRLGTTVNSPTVTATGGSGAVDPRLIEYDAGTGIGVVVVARPSGAAANWAIIAEKVTLTANAVGIAPTVVVNSTVTVQAGAITTTNAFGFSTDLGDTDYGVVCYYQAGTALAFNGLSGLKGSGAITAAAQTLVPNGAVAPVVTGAQRYIGAAGLAPVVPVGGAGMISNSRTLWFDSYGAGAWRAVQMSAAFTRFVKITRGAGATWSFNVGDISMPDGTASVYSLFPFSTYSSRYPTPSAVNTDPTFAIISNATIAPAAGPQGGSKVYVMTEQGGAINFIDSVAANNFSFRDNTTTAAANIGIYTPFQSLLTKSGYIVVPIGDPTNTNTSQLSFNTYAFFKLDANGSLRYFGRWPLPLKAVNEVVFNTVWGVQDNEVNIVGNSVEFDGSPGEGIHFRRFLKIDFAVVS